MYRIYIFILFFGIFSCDKECNDCGLISSSRYYLKNNSNDDLKLIFYENTTQIKYDTISIEKNQRIPFLFLSTGSPAKTILSLDYAIYDSIKIINNSEVKSLINDIENCSNVYNVLCKSNYNLILEQEEKLGNKYSEYELIIK